VEQETKIGLFGWVFRLDCRIKHTGIFLCVSGCLVIIGSIARLSVPHGHLTQKQRQRKAKIRVNVPRTRVTIFSLKGQKIALGLLSAMYS